MTNEMINMDIWSVSNINQNHLPAFLMGTSKNVIEPERPILNLYGSFCYPNRFYGSEFTRAKDIVGINPLYQIQALLMESTWRKSVARYSIQTIDVKPTTWRIRQIPYQGFTITQPNKPAIDELISLSELDPLDITRQLEDMKRMNDGWADGMQTYEDWGNGFGTAPSHIGLDWLAGEFTRNYTDDLPKPHLYPMPEGGIQAEWSVGTYELSLEVNLSTHVAEWYSLNLQTDVDHEIQIDLNRADSWSWMTNEIRRLGHETK